LLKGTLNSIKLIIQPVQSESNETRIHCDVENTVLLADEYQWLRVHLRTSDWLCRTSWVLSWSVWTQTFSWCKTNSFRCDLRTSCISLLFISS